MANFFTRALDKLTPWNRGGEVVRNQQAQARKKKKQDNEQTSVTGLDFTQPRQNPQPQQPKPQRPENLFADLNTNLRLPLKLPSNSVSIQTDTPVAKKPSFWQTAKDTAIGTVANVPEVGLAAGRAATGIVQGVTQLPHIATAATATATQKLNNVAPNRVTHAINMGAQGLNTGVNAVTKVVDKPFGVVNRGLDRAAQGYENRVPGAAGGAEAYRATQVPLNVLAGLLTLGGASATEAGNAGKLGQVTRFLNKPRTSNPNNVIARTSQAVNKGAPVVHAINRPISTARRGVQSGLGRLTNSRVLPTATRDVTDAGEIGNVLTEAQLQELTRPPTQIPVGTGIDVNGPPGAPVTVPVHNVTPTGPIIRELGGDSPNVTRVPTPDEVATQRATSRLNSQAPGRPDPAIEGVTPRTPTQPYKLAETDVKAAQDNVVDQYAAMLKDVGEGNGTQLVTDGEGGYTRTSNNYRTSKNAGKKMSKQDWRDQAEAELKAGKAEPGLQKAFDDANNPDVQSLITKGEQPTAPEGRPIAVKQATGIPVTDQTVVPQGLPETPGTVRATTNTAPANAEATAAANAPVTSSPAQLPAETQAILDNPKKYSKRQVASARNQRKLARQMAKTQEQTAEAMSRIETASPPGTSPEGFVSTGEFGASANGGAYQKVGRNSEMQQALQETSQMSPGDVLQTARRNQTETGSFNRRDIRNVMAMFESKRIPRGTPEYNEAKAILKEDGTVQAQALALRGGNVIRRTATADQLVSQYESKLYRLVDDPTKIDSKAFDEVDAAEQKFTAARDEATGAYNRFTENPTGANAKAYHAAQDAADAADKQAKMIEFKIAQKVLKGNKDVKQVRELQKMAGEADLYQMDAIDASMLSGTGTFVRNFVNAAVGGSEEGLFGGVASRIANKLTGENVGGGFGRGTLSGFGKGVRNVVDASKARASNAGKNPLEHFKNWSTTGNQLGDTIIDSQVSHNVVDHYTQLLKDQGYKGRELRDRASVMARQDPDEVGKVYAGYARAAAGLGSGITKGSKVESIIREGISNAISGGNPNQVSELTAKLLTRMTVGFPSAVGRTISEGAKRATLGAPTALKLFSKGARNDPAVRAQIIKESIKQAGTGATTGAIFYKLGQEGLVTGGYPSDPEERARWQREGITENSIKIGRNYYQLPAFLGVAAVPALFAATLGRNNGDVNKSAGEVAKGLPSILPTDQASNVLDFINGRIDPGKFAAQTGASAVRALTPVGALLNQISKSFDPTANDTTSGTALENFVDKVLSGIPGQNKFADIPDKVDDAGNPIHNPSALPLGLGASSTEQGAGEQRTADLQAEVNNQAQGLKDTGALGDSNLKDVLDDKNLQIYNKLNSGKEVTDKELTSLQDALVKGVSTTGEDTAYLEKGQYDTNLAALRLKKKRMEEDKTTKPSDVEKLDVAIKRGQVYKDETIPYDMIQAYESTGIDDWRSMGDPENDNYDPDMYQKLWDIDQTMTKAGVSYKKGALDKNKFYAKDSNAGGKGSRGGYSSDFGTLKAGTGAPSVRAYDTIDQASGSVPHIGVVRPNIVHKISSSG